MRKYVKHNYLLLIITFLSLMISYEHVSADYPEGNFRILIRDIKNELPGEHSSPFNNYKYKYDEMGRIVHWGLRELSFKAGLRDAGWASLSAAWELVKANPLSKGLLSLYFTADTFFNFLKGCENKKQFSEKLADELLRKAANSEEDRNKLTAKLSLRTDATDEQIRIAVKDQFEELYEVILLAIHGENEEFNEILNIKDRIVSGRRLPDGKFAISGYFDKSRKIIKLIIEFNDKTGEDSDGELHTGHVVTLTYLKFVISKDNKNYKWEIGKTEVKILNTNLTKKKKVPIRLETEIKLPILKSGDSGELKPGVSCKVITTATARDKQDKNNIIKLEIAKANIIGIDKVSMDSIVPKASGLPSQKATFTFNIATPLNDKRYKLSLTVTAEEGSSGSKNVYMDIINVSPIITREIDGSAATNPGEIMELNNIKVYVADDNADGTKDGKNEVLASDLKIIIKKKQSRSGILFLKNSNVKSSLVSFDKKTGYVFNFTYRGTVNKIHLPGEFTASVTVKDDNGEISEPKFIKLKVNNVAPTISNIKITPNPIIERDDKNNMITITGRIGDANSNSDINLEKCYVDVSAASSDQGKLTFKNGGLVILNENKIDAYHEFVEFKTTAPFLHLNKEGEYKIIFYAADKSGKEIKASKSLIINKSDNKPPRISGFGLEKGIFCPGESFTVKVRVKDDENDHLRVIAKLMKKKKESALKTFLMQKVKESLYEATLIAPSEIGNYKVRINAREYIINKDGSRIKFQKASNFAESSFKVKNSDFCDSNENTDIDWKAKVSPKVVSPKARFTVEAFINESWKKKATKVVYPPGIITFLNKKQEVGPNKKKASFIAPEGKGTYPVMILLNYKNPRGETIAIRMGPVIIIKDGFVIGRKLKDVEPDETQIKVLAGNDVKDRTHVDSATGVMFIDLNNTISRNSVVKSWRIFTSPKQKGIGRIKLKIFRDTGSVWKLVGESPLETVTRWGRITTFVLREPIKVKKGDLMAWWYPKSTVPSVVFSAYGQTMNNNSWPWDPLPDIQGDIPNLNRKELHGPWGVNPRTYSIQLLTHVPVYRPAAGGEVGDE